MAWVHCSHMSDSVPKKTTQLNVSPVSVPTDSCKGRSVTCQLYAAESSTLLAKSLAPQRTHARQFTLLIDFQGKLHTPDANPVSVPQPADSDWASACSKVLGEEGSLSGGLPFRSQGQQHLLKIN